MASFPSLIQFHCSFTSSSSSSSSSSSVPSKSIGKLGSPFMPVSTTLGWFRASKLWKAKFCRLGRGSDGGAKCWFKFGKNGVDAEGAGVYGSQSREDFGRDDVEQYFNYMGMLAVEGTYEKMNALLDLSIHPVDILLLLAAAEGDKPKIEELLRAGAKCDVKDEDGNTALDRANDEIRDFILELSIQNV